MELSAEQLADALKADCASEWPRPCQLEVDRLAAELGQPERPVDARACR